jgi:EmrB/QacA subfamily drug resistance transporter
MDDSPRQRRSALLVCMAASFLTPFSSSALNLAIPAIGRDLGAGAVTLSWVVTSFLLASASLLLPAGRLADIVGRKRVFIAGVALYSATSLACGLAHSAAALIAARIGQGVGASMIFATSLAIVTSAFPAGERGRVLGVSVTAVYVGLSVGPLVGGVLTESLGWRSIFLLTAALGFTVALLPALRLRGDWVGARGERFDVGGACLIAVGLVAALHGMSSLSTGRLAPATLAVGVACLALFLLWERRASNPLLDLRTVTGNAAFAFSNLAALINYSATFAVTFVLSLHLQVVRGLDARHAGAVLLVQPVMMAALSTWAGRLSDRREPRVIASAGMAITAAGLLILCLLPARAPLALMVVALAVVGTGFALFSSPNSNAVMGAVARAQYGVAAAVLSSMRLIGQALSMALVTLILGARVGGGRLDAAAAPQLLASERTAFALFTVLCVAGVFASLARGPLHTTSDR